MLGPKIYCMYTKPVSDIIQRHGLSHHSYADDTQLIKIENEYYTTYETHSKSINVKQPE